jgi:hypothetical protein
VGLQNPDCLHRKICTAANLSFACPKADEHKVELRSTGRAGGLSSHVRIKPTVLARATLRSLVVAGATL